MRALRDFNIPKIVTDDLPVFMGLIGDLFPALEVPRKRDLNFEKVGPARDGVSCPGASSSSPRWSHTRPPLSPSQSSLSTGVSEELRASDKPCRSHGLGEGHGDITWRVTAPLWYRPGQEAPQPRTQPGPVPVPSILSCAQHPPRAQHLPRA